MQPLVACLLHHQKQMLFPSLPWRGRLLKHHDVLMISAISLHLDFPVRIDGSQSNAPSLMASGLLSLAGPNLVPSRGSHFWYVRCCKNLEANWKGIKVVIQHFFPRCPFASVELKLIRFKWVKWVRSTSPNSQFNKIQQNSTMSSAIKEPWDGKFATPRNSSLPQGAASLWT